MWIAKDVASLREYRAKAHGRVALVPTMGALHDGHVSLIKRAHEIGHTVIVSLFVNPTQFAPHEDLEKYPRPFEADVKKCLDAGVDGLFAPTVDAMYPPEVVGCDVNIVVDNARKNKHKGTHDEANRGRKRAVATRHNQHQPVGTIELSCDHPVPPQPPPPPPPGPIPVAHA